MINNKDNEIILCKGIKLDRNYENVLSYSESDMVTLCRNNAIYEADEYNFIEKSNNRIVVSHPYSSAMYANYVAFKNPRFGNKWIFAWVTDVKLINIGSTEITFEVDVWSTWYSRFTLNQAFIEREHVSDDTIGKHTIPENLETGEYIIDNKIKNNNYDYDNVCFILATTTYPYITQEDGKWVLNGGNATPCNVYNSILSGLEYFWYLNTPNGITQLQHTIQAFANSGKSDSIYMLFTCPDSCFEKVFDGDQTNYTWGSVKQKQGSYNTTWDQGGTDPIYRPTTINGYTPKNNKLFTFPYCYILMNNGNGGNAVYHYELFKNNSNVIYFEIEHAICPGASIFLRPVQYSYDDPTFKDTMDGLPLGKFPMCSWNSDAYVNWLTQNSANIKMGLISGGVDLGGSIMQENPMGIAKSSLGLISNVMQLYNKRDTMTPQAQGNLNSGDVIYSAQETTFTCYQMSIKREFAVAIDRYFSRFGYKVNEVKTPNLNSRTQFNFIKVGGMDELVHGDIPSTDLEKINEICRKGVTIFHSYSNIGNYTINNPIVS